MQNASKSSLKVDLANLKSDEGKLKNVSKNQNNLKSKADELDVDNLVSVPVNLSKISDVVKIMLLKKMYIMLRLTILRIKSLILLT